MTKRSLTLPALASLGLLMVGGAGCGSQRRVACAPEASDFNVKLTYAGMKTGTGDCDTRFDGSESVQVFGLQPYFNKPGAADQVNSLAIRPFETGNYAASALNAMPPATDTVSTHTPSAVGKFDSEYADSSDICHIMTMKTAAEVQYDTAFTVPGDNGGAGGDVDGGSDDGGGDDDGGTAAADFDGGTDGGASEAGASSDAAKDASGPADASGSADASAPADGGASGDDGGGGGDAGMCVMPPPDMGGTPDMTFAPLHVKYEFSNIRLFVNAALTGSILAGDLTYTQFNGAATCVAKYTFRGIAPSVACSDDCGNPSDDLCHDPQNGLPQPNWDQEGTNPTYMNKTAIYSLCDKDAQQCVLDPKDPHIP